MLIEEPDEIREDVATAEYIGIGGAVLDHRIAMAGRDFDYYVLANGLEEAHWCESSGLAGMSW